MKRKNREIERMEGFININFSIKDLEGMVQHFLNFATPKQYYALEVFLKAREKELNVSDDSFKDMYLERVKAMQAYLNQQIKKMPKKNHEKYEQYSIVGDIKEVRATIRSLEKEIKEDAAGINKVEQSIADSEEVLSSVDELLTASDTGDSDLEELDELREELQGLVDQTKGLRKTILNLSIKSEQLKNNIVKGLTNLIASAGKLIKRVGEKNVERKAEKEFPSKINDLILNLTQVVIQDKKEEINRLTKEINTLIDKSSDKKALKEVSKKLFNIYIKKDDTPKAQRDVFAPIIEKLDVKVNKLEQPKVKRAFFKGSAELRQEKKAKRQQEKEEKQEQKRSREL